MMPLVILGGIISLVSGFALLMIRGIPTLLTLGIVLPLWLLFLYVADYVLLHLRGRKRIVPLSLSAALGLTLLMSALDNAHLTLAIALGGAAFLGLLYALATVRGALLPPAQKRVRRYLVAAWTFTVYAFLTGQFACIIFFPTVPWWLMTLSVSFFSAFAALCIWREYEPLPKATEYLWFLVVLVPMIELTWVLTMLPFDYFVSGFIAAWVWYVLQLFIRFHVSRQGILWHKHTWFLLGNVFAMLLFFVFVVRVL
jgi:hypothetical protein